MNTVKLIKKKLRRAARILRRTKPVAVRHTYGSNRQIKRSMFRSMLKRKYDTTLRNAMKMTGCENQRELEQHVRDNA